MAPSPTPGTGRRSSSLISQLAEDLNRSRSEYLQSSPHSPVAGLPEFTESSFAPSKDGLVSTQQINFVDDDTTNQLPQIRTTARARRFGVPRQEPLAVNTSMVEQEFHDFDSRDMDEDNSMSIEMGRGAKHTPSKLNQSHVVSPNVYLSMGEDDSIYEVTGTPGSRPRPTARKSEGLERENLRREAQVRRAASLGQKEIESMASRTIRSQRPSPEKTAGNGRRRTSLAQIQARINSEMESQLLDDDPPTITVSSKNTRFGNQRSRQTSANVPTKFSSGRGLEGTSRSVSTPRRGTPRTANVNATFTANSFALPDLPNLTELVSGVYQDGTPVFSRNTPARSRFPSGRKRGLGEDTKRFNIVGEIPLPTEEKAILASLQLLQEKVAELEREKSNAERKIEDYETRVVELETELQAKENLRRPDSGLGSTDGEGSKKQDWRTEKIRIETTVQSLQSRLDRAERKNTTSDIAVKRITKERDGLVTQLGVATMVQEELKRESEELTAENDALRREVECLREENDELRNQLSEADAQYQEETQRWETERIEIQQRAGRSDRAVVAENEQLRKELARERTQHDEETQRFNLEKVELKKQAAREARAEYNQLKTENEKLHARLAKAKAEREEELRRLKEQEEELRKKVQRRDDTIHQLQDMTQQGSSDELRQENETLRAEIEKLQKESQRQTESQEVDAETLLTRRTTFSRRRASEHVETSKSKDEVSQQAHPARSKPSSAPARVVTEESTETRIRSGPSDTRSKSQTRRRAAQSEPAHTQRSVAQDFAYERHQDENVSDAESTTDLDLSQSVPAPAPAQRVQPRKISRAPATKAFDPPTQTDTYISLLQPERRDSLRKRIEEEHIARRRRSSVRQEQTEASRSVADVTTGLTRRSSLRENTTNTTRSVSLPVEEENKDNEDIDASELVLEGLTSRSRKDDTKQSLMSNTSRRRRSTAPVEMTSAFILPDITIRNVPLRPTLSEETRTALKSLSPHDSKSCTICSRVLSQSEANVDIPKLKLVSQRPEIAEDPDATMRPSQHPRSALETVIKQLEDELAHIQMAIAAEDAKLQAHDPALGRRKRQTIEAQMMQLTKEHGVKADQVYALYDALEAHKNDENDVDITEAELNDTLRSVGLDPEDVTTGRRTNGKRVVIESFHDSEDDQFDDDDSEKSEELAWEGCSDTESIHSRGARRRSGLY